MARKYRSYLTQPKGRGYAFQIKIPTPLVGRFKSHTGRPLRKIVEGLATTDLREAEAKAARRRVHWLQVFERAKHDVPLTLAEIQDEAMETYRLHLGLMMANAATWTKMLGDEGTWLRATLEYHRTALAASDFSGPRADVEAIERRRGVQLDPGSETYATLARALQRARIAAIEGRLKALDGQPSAEPENLLGADGIDPLTLRPAKLDQPRAPAIRSGVGPWALFEQWIEEAKPAPSTVNRWRAVFTNLQGRFGQRSISEDEAREWARGLVNAERSADTAAGVWLSSAKTIYRWAAEQKLVTLNPFATVKLVVPGKAIIREKAFTDDEAATILRAALAIEPDENTFRAAQRWVPWLCAYSGARAGEITQLRGQDVREIDGVWAMVLTPEAGTLKTKHFRTVPLHKHLLDQDFLKFVKARGAGPLFYNPGGANGDDASNPKRPRAVKARERLAAWVRELGITDPGVRPNHAWRHTFKQIAERSGISERISDAITGHAPTTAGRGYGKPTVADMAEALKRFPRYM